MGASGSPFLLVLGLVLGAGLLWRSLHAIQPKRAIQTALGLTAITWGLTHLSVTIGVLSAVMTAALASPCLPFAV